MIPALTPVAALQVRGSNGAETRRQPAHQAAAAIGPSLLQQLAAGQAGAALTFAGQGAPWLDELSVLYREVPGCRDWIHAAAAQMASDVEAQAFRWSGLYPRGIDLMAWLQHPAQRPDAAYLGSAAVSQPLLFLCQMARYRAAFDAGLGTAVAAGHVRVLTGHSQGMMPALLVAESPGGAVATDRLLAYVRYLTWQGLHMAQSYAQAAGPAGSSPMAAVSGVAVAALAETVAAVNAGLAVGDHLAIALYNTRTRNVVSGAPAQLERLRLALQARGEREVRLKREGRFAGKPTVATWEFIDVGAPFHSPHMAAGLAAMQATARELGFRVHAADLRLPVLSPADGSRYNDCADLTAQLMVDQFSNPVRWQVTVQRLAALDATDCVLDLGPGDGVAKLSASALRGTGIPVLALATARGWQHLLACDSDRPQKPLCYQVFQPGLARLPDGRLVVDNRYTRATGQPPVLLPGMTPTTVDAPIVAAAANAGFTAELAGGGQVTEAMFWLRLRELEGLLRPGAEVAFNALYLDPYLWDLHIRKGLVAKARRAGLPLSGVTVSAGIPEVDEAVRLLHDLRAAGLWLNAFKPGTTAQVEQVVRIAKAAPDHTIFLHLEGGRAGGHHSWEDLDDLLIDTYASIRDQPNLVLCVGGGIGDETRATELLTGAWSRRHGLLPMPVDAVFLGTLAMACLEATATADVKRALVEAAGTESWVFAGEAKGAVTSGKSQLNADIHYLDNAASRCGRLLDRLAGDAVSVAANKAAIIEALNTTAKPWFGDLEAMTWLQVLERAVELMAVGRHGRYEDGAWPDRSYRERVLDLLRRAEARLCPQGEGEVVSLFAGPEDLDAPQAALDRLLAQHPTAATRTLHAADIGHFVHKICARPGKPVNFVPLIDGDVRRWYKADALWQAQDDRYGADQVLVIPGPNAVRGIRRVDEPVADLLGRFERAAVASLVAAGVQPMAVERLRGPRAAAARGLPVGIEICHDDDATTLRVVQPLAGTESWGEFVAAHFGGPIAALFGPARVFCDRAPAANPVPALCRADVGASLRIEATADGVAAAVTWQSAAAPGESVRLLREPAGVRLEAHTASLDPTAPAVAFTLRLQHCAPAQGEEFFAIDPSAQAESVSRFYHQALFGAPVEPVPLFAAAHAEVTVPAERVHGYAALTGAARPVGGTAAELPMNMAFSLVWQPLFQALSCPELAGGWLRLVHLDHRVETGPGWPLRAGERLLADVRVTRIEDGDSGRRVATQAWLRREADAGATACARIDSTFFVRGAFGQTPLALRSSEPVTATLALADAASVSFLLDHEWLCMRPGVTLRPGAALQLEATLGEIRPRHAAAQFTAQGTLRQDDQTVADIDLAVSGARHEHPLRTVLALLAPVLPAAVATPPRTLGQASDRTPAHMTAFAEVSGDGNPIHRSLVAARLAGLDQPIVHGMWTAARLHALVVAVGAAGNAARIHSYRAEFLDIAWPDEALELVAVRTAVERGEALVQATASVRRGDRWVVVVQAQARIRPPRTAYVFPGQGIQQRGMGMDGYARSAAARAIWDRADAFTRQRLGFSILAVVRDNPRELALDGGVQVHPEGVLHLTQFTQVSMAVLALAQVAELREAGVLDETAIACGHSVGEYNALAAYVGVLPLESVVDIVYQRGCAMHAVVARDATGDSGYRMGVIRPHYAGLDHLGAERLVAEIRSQTGQFLQIVNYNVRGRQYAVTGRTAALAALQAALAQRSSGGRTAYLEVPGIDVPFHSEVLREKVAAFRHTLDTRLPQTMAHARLVGRYVPNLVPRAFSLQRPFVAEVQAATGSQELAAVLASADLWANRPDALARLLLVELLAWQFASPVRWIETQDLLLTHADAGGLGVARVVEVGVGYQPTLANMARYSLELLGSAAGKVDVRNVEADAVHVFGRDADAADDGVPAEPAAPAPAPPAGPAVVATVVQAPVLAAGPAAAVVDQPLSVAEALRVLLAVQARVRPEQIRDTETIDELFDGVSSRRNQVLLDLGAEFDMGTIDGAHEKPIAVLAVEVAKRAGTWKSAAALGNAGRYLRATQDDTVRRVLGRAGLGRKEVLDYLQEGWGLGAGHGTGVLCALVLAARDGDSGRGGRLGAGLDPAPATRAAGLGLLDAVVAAWAQQRGLAVQRRGGAQSAAGGAVDAAVVRELEARLAGFDGVLMRTARDLAGHLGHRLDAAPAVEPARDVATAAHATVLDRELGAVYAALVAPAFDARKHVALRSAWAWAQRDVARLFFQASNGQCDARELAAEAARLRGHGGDRRVADTAHWYAAQAATAGQVDLAAALRTIAAAGTAVAVPVQPTRPQLSIRADGTLDYSEVPDPNCESLAELAEALLPATGAAVLSLGSGGHWNPAFRQILQRTAAAAADFAGRTALVTGASPGSIAAELIRHLLRGGARVVMTTSSYDSKRLRWCQALYQRDAAPGAELHVVPFNQASVQDIDALVEWLFAEVTEQAGAGVRTLKRAWLPDLVVPFAALKDLGTLDTLGARAEASLRAMLLGVERLVAGIARRHLQRGLSGLPCHVLLPLSPNHGSFGGDGAYAETKAGLEVLLAKWRSEHDTWGRAVTLAAVRIGWVRGTGLMDANDPVAARLEALDFGPQHAGGVTGVRTFSSAEMGWLLAALCTPAARAEAAGAPLDADLTGGFGRLGDVRAVVQGIRERLDADMALARRKDALVRAEAARLGTGAVAMPRVRALDAWPRPLLAAAAAPVAATAAIKYTETMAESLVRDAAWPAGRVPLERMVVLVGAGEIGPCGSARTRHELEVDGELSAAGVLDLAWSTGLVRFERGGRGGAWLDAVSGEEVDEADLASRYRSAVQARVGIRQVDAATAGFDPARLPVLATVYLERDLEFAVPTEAEARTFVAADPEHTRIAHDATADRWRVTRLAGAAVRVPREVRLPRTVAGLVPQGLDFTRYGIPKDMVDHLDRVTLFNLVATVDAFLSAGLDPEELLRHVHPARVGNTQGGGIGGMRSLHRLYLDHLLDAERQTDVLQETLINVMAGYVVQAYVGSYGPMVHPVGACATAAVSLEEAMDKILCGKADFVVAGGYDDYGPEGAVGFFDMNATASSDDMQAMGLLPAEMSRPNDLRRRGFVEAQGGGTLLVTRGDVALAMGLPVLGVLAHVGSHGDGIHKSIPAPGLGALASAMGGADSPLGRALADFGLQADDIALVYKHDTSTGANDPNENQLHHRIQETLGRTPGNPLFVVSQKSLTGHAKGGAAAWQVIGLCQALAAGVVPGNRNLQCVDDAMRRYGHLGFTDATLRPGPATPLRAGLLTSLGFGHVGAIGLVLHADAFHAAVPAAARTAYAQARDRRLAQQTRAGAAILLGERSAFAKRSQRRFVAADGTDAQAEAEAALLLDPHRRLGADGLYDGPANGTATATGGANAAEAAS